MRSEAPVPLFELRDVWLEGPEGVLFERLTWTVRDAACTVLLGPSGTGKSTLLQAMAGQLDLDSWSWRGEWRYRGRNRPPAAANTDAVWSPQQTHAWARNRRRDGRRPLSVPEAFASGCHTLLLDEPTRGAPGEELERIPSLLRDHVGRGGAAVIVTHDLRFARQVANVATLVVAGCIHTNGEAPGFFDRPPSDMTARFLKQGNCSVAATAPPLPTHFHWILPGRLAGMGYPGLLNEVEDDLAAIADAGITRLISLTEQSFPPVKLRSFGITARHYPIRDMGVPPTAPTARLCRDIERAIDEGECVAVHCRAGMGRTGLMLASVLVWLGRDPAAAIEEVRGVNRGFIQNRAQLDFVHRLAESVPPAIKRARTG